MSDKKVIPGESINVIVMPKGWTRKDLYLELKEFFGKTELNLKKYSRYFLKIIGTYDTSLVDEFSQCRICPHNFRYRGYHDYNEMLDEKVPVLVLTSETPDFESYDVVASYYTNKVELVEGTATIEVKAKKKWYLSLF